MDIFKSFLPAISAPAHLLNLLPGREDIRGVYKFYLVRADSQTAGPLTLNVAAALVAKVKMADLALDQRILLEGSSAEPTAFSSFPCNDKTSASTSTTSCPSEFLQTSIFSIDSRIHQDFNAFE